MKWLWRGTFIPCPCVPPEATKPCARLVNDSVLLKKKRAQNQICQEIAFIKIGFCPAFQLLVTKIKQTSPSRTKKVVSLHKRNIPRTLKLLPNFHWYGNLKTFIEMTNHLPISLLTKSINLHLLLFVKSQSQLICWTYRFLPQTTSTQSEPISESEQNHENS